MKHILEQPAHSPTLKTILMVETVLKTGDLMTIADIKRKLPKKIMHNTLLHILDYLQHSGKIIISTKGVLWIFTEQKELEKLKKAGLEI